MEMNQVRIDWKGQRNVEKMEKEKMKVVNRERNRQSELIERGRKRE